MLAALGKMSRGRARRLIEVGGVYLDGKRTLRVSTPVGPGRVITAVLYAEEVAVRSQARLAAREPRIVHREASFAILDKPPGIAVQATRATVRGTLESWMRAQPGVDYLAFHHRLDSSARGLIAVALHKSANRGLAAAFRDRTAERRYCAVVEGLLRGEGVWEHAQVQRSGKRRAVPVGKGRGQLMRSRWRSLEVGPDRTLLEVSLETGRTHQIRLQAAAEGHPVVGDLLYGAQDPGGMHLQAIGLGLPHPRTGRRVEWALDPPPEWGAALAE
jgi:RluA family pseudouridine synthase